jgi:hypothetical protein
MIAGYKANERILGRGRHRCKEGPVWIASALMNDANRPLSVRKPAAGKDIPENPLAVMKLDGDHNIVIAAPLDHGRFPAAFMSSLV